MKKQNIKIKLKNMSKNPGVYKMLDRTRNVIYIGKAKNLKNEFLSILLIRIIITKCKRSKRIFTIFQS